MYIHIIAIAIVTTATLFAGADTVQGAHLHADLGIPRE